MLYGNFRLRRGPRCKRIEQMKRMIMNKRYFVGRVGLLRGADVLGPTILLQSCDYIPKIRDGTLISKEGVRKGRSSVIFQLSLS
jgi:hypothetical protein